jgi:hypothetical protein
MQILNAVCSLFQALCAGLKHRSEVCSDSNSEGVTPTYNYWYADGAVRDADGGHVCGVPGAAADVRAALHHRAHGGVKPFCNVNLPQFGCAAPRAAILLCPSAPRCGMHRPRQHEHPTAALRGHLAWYTSLLGGRRCRL